MATLQVKASNLNSRTTSSSSLSSPSVVKTSTNKWDDQVLPQIEKLGLDKELLSYENTKFIRNAYNGQYWNAMQKVKGSNPEAYESLKKLHNVSTAFGNELKKENPNGELLSSYFSKANQYQAKIADIFSSKEAAYRLDFESGKILNEKEYRKKSNDVVQFSDITSNTTKIVKDFGILGLKLRNTNDAPSYDYLRGIEKQHMSKIKKATKSYVSEWVDNSLTNSLPSEARRADVNKNAFQLTTDLLTFVMKYGTTGADKETQKKDQALARNILQKVYNKPPNEQLAFFKSQNETIRNITDRLGFHGSNYVFNKYKKQIGNDATYYDYESDDNPSKKLDGIKKIEEYQKVYSEFGDISKKLKTSAYKEALESKGSNEYFKNISMDHRVGLNALVDDNGNIVSYSKFRSRIPNGFKMNGSTFNVGVMGSQGVGSEELEKGLRKNYYNLAKGYKVVLDERKAKLSYEKTLLEQGFGNESRKAVGFESVDLSVNEYGSLKSFSSPKQKNLTKLWSLFKNDNGTFGNPQHTIFVPGKVSTKLLESDELSDFSKESDKTMKSFLKSDPKDVRLVFLKNTNVPGFSQYKFINNETGESINAFIKSSVLGSRGIKEDLYSKSKSSLEEFNFEATGKKQLLNRTNKNGETLVKDAYVYKNPKTNAFELKFKVMVNGNWKSTTFEGVPNVSLDEATKAFDKSLNLLAL
jgi:hypothetical protein